MTEREGMEQVPARSGDGGFVLCCLGLAERVGFEPTRALQPYTLSRRA